MSATGFEMRQNRFRPDSLAGGEGARRPLPKNATPASALRASGFGPTGLAVSSPDTAENKSLAAAILQIKRVVLHHRAIFCQNQSN